MDKTVNLYACSKAYKLLTNNYILMLYDLISLLDSWKIIDRSRLLDDSDEAFEFRLKVQKAAYLLRYLGISPFNNYSFGIYLYGPYSPDLAKDYYNGTPLEFTADKNIIQKLEWFVKHSDSRWLEVASSILYIYDRYSEMSKENVLSLLRLSKPWITDKLFESIHDDLLSKGLVRFCS